MTMTLIFSGLSGPAGAGDSAPNGQDADARARRFVERYEAEVRPLEIEAARAAWDANVTGREEDFKKKQAAEEKIDLALSNPERFAELKALKQSPPADPVLARQVEVLYLGYLGKQVDPELLKKISAKSNAMERAFNLFRPKVGDRELTDNDVKRILRESTDSAERQAAWEAGKKVGAVIADDLKELVKLRNEAARKLGFANYYAMRLFLTEQSEEELVKLFDELDALTREPFRAAKAAFDAVLAQKCGIEVDALRPWHYHDPFFQQAPAVLGELPEEVYKPLDTVEVCRAFYRGIGLPVDDVLARSDLYEKPGKNPHAFSIDLDRAGDVRILENVVPGREWLGVTLHELGHAVYSKNAGCGASSADAAAYDDGLESAGPRTKFPCPMPYVLRAEAHILTTEGIAMMFERFAQNVDWLLAVGAKVPDPDRFRAAALRLQRNRMLVFARYCQVMFRFERELYRDPDQDLNRLWWDLVEKYQEMKRPEGRDAPDYASKYHFTGAPVYYHNYMLGEMFASQLHRAMVGTLTPKAKPSEAIYVGNPSAGEFLKRRVFQPGMMLRWNDLTQYATGEPLGAKAFAADIAEEAK